jgi:hypothetical protein
MMMVINMIVIIINIGVIITLAALCFGESKANAMGSFAGPIIHTFYINLT